ncbi:MAG TPA: CDP-alcohol phosphatidyltransferase family protein [Actinomycetota bacterium]
MTTRMSSRRVLTVPNAISFARILLIPVFVALLVHHGTEAAGLLLLAAVVSTDWVDGQVARRTGQVTELGKILDPVADRLAIAAALIALVARGAFPLWAALLILVRDAAILVAGLLLLRRGGRIDVRFIGKVATFCLMFAVPAVAWGNFGLGGDATLLALGWISYGVGIVEYYIATALYVRDFRDALRTTAS